MGDLDDGLAGDLVATGRHEACLGQRVDHAVDLGLLLGAGHQLAALRPAPGVLGALTGLGQAQQHAPRDGLAFRIHPPVHLVGAPGERALDASGRRVRLERQRPITATAPQLVQQVLEQGQGARTVGDVGEDAAGEAGLQLEAAAAGRLLDGPAQAPGVERPDEHLVIGDQSARLGVLGEPVVEVGPHRGDDDGPPAGDRGGVDEVPEEGGALTLVVAEGEDLLELVDDDQHPVPGRPAVECPGDRHVQGALVGGEVGRRWGAGARQVGELRSEGGEGSRAREDLEDPPLTAAGDRVEAKRRQQTGLHQRALPAARGAHHGDEARRAQALDQARDILLAAEEEVGVLLAEGLQAAVGRHVLGRRRQARGNLGAAEGANEVGGRHRVAGAGAQIDPGLGREVGQARIAGVRGPRKEHEHQPEGAVAHGQRTGGGEALAGPVAEAAPAHEHGARARRPDALGRPRLSGHREQGQHLRLAQPLGQGLGGLPLVGGEQQRHVIARGQGGPAELAGAREAILGALGHRPPHDVVERRRQAGHQRRGRRDLRLEVRRESGLLVAGREGRAAGERVEEHAPEGVDVGAGVERLAANLLGSEVGQSSGPLAVAARGAGAVDAQAEVRQVDVLLAVGVGDQHVRRLDVAVHQAAGVRGVEGVGDAGHDPGDAPRGQTLGRLGDQVLQARPLHEAHGDEQPAVVLAGPVDRDDVRVLQARGGERLAHEELAQTRVAGALGRDQLERDRASELGVVGPVDDAHAADAGERLDGVAGDDRARRHTGGRHRIAPAPREDRVASADIVRHAALHPGAIPTHRWARLYFSRGDFR